MNESILVIAPHADDEIIGCGATMAQAIERGIKVYVLIATNAHVGAPDLYTKERMERVRREALDAHAFLGVEETFFMEFPAPSLNNYPEYLISLQMVEIIKKIKPKILYLPFPGDMHQDHKAIYRASLVAARPIGDCSVKEIYCYETLSETEWGPYYENGFIPNVFNDVSQVFEKKLEAMKRYKFLIRTFPHPRSLENFEALAKYRGATIGVARAESFVVERMIK